MIEIKNLRLKFKNSQNLLFDNLNLKILPKQKVLLLGSSGCGKTTLLHLLGGVIPKLIDVPFKAEVLKIDNKNAFVFQDPDISFCMPSVYEELAFVLENQNVNKDDMLSLIQNVLKKVHLKANITTQIAQLSGGGKQKLSIASAFLQNPSTLFLDEPTSMLDESSTKLFWDNLKQIWQNLRVLIIEHKITYVQNLVDRVILMDNFGKIICDKTPKEIFSFSNLLNSMGVWHLNSWQNAPKLDNNFHKTNFCLSIKEANIYHEKQNLFSIENFQINSSDFISIQGENGSGKSSFFNFLLKLIKCKGDVRINDKIISNTKEASKFIYLVFQNPSLQFITNKVFDEIAINFENPTKVTKVLHSLDLQKLKNAHPYELSMGQKRRLSVATALSQNISLILLDEPTFGLDSKNTFELIKILHSLRKQGIAIMIATHDEELSKTYANKRYIIEDKRLKRL